ncbi:hypothetical protein ACEQ8H_006067 [Pleosporales sp. CAS-2024a]
MLSYSSFQPESPVKIGAFTPFRGRRTPTHERTRPMTMTSPPPTMQHLKRSSIYVSDASILLSHKSPILSPKSPPDSLSLAGEMPDFIDHYANLELEPNASIDDVKSAFRRLRGQYFMTDAIKYRAAQAAFDVLANPVARQDYDSLYRSRPAPPNAPSSLAEVLDRSKHGRADSAHGDDPPALPVLSEEEEADAGRSQDANWGLKRHRRLYEPVIGSLPYASYIPILQLYDGFQRHPVLGCRRPVYIGEIAIYSRPN